MAWGEGLIEKTSEREEARAMISAKRQLNCD